VKRQIELLVTISHEAGLHVRPAMIIGRILQNRKSRVVLTYKDESVDARSIMGIMRLAVPYKAKIKLEVEGKDAEETLQALLLAFKNGFSEY